MWSALKRLIWLFGSGVAGGESAVWETATGAVASFITQISAPLRSCVVGIEPVQSGSGDPSPTNVRPITGWTGVNVTRTGKNLCPINTMRTSHNGIDYIVTDIGIRVHGTAISASYSWEGGMDYASTWIKLPAGTYTFSVTDMFGTSQLDGYVVFIGWDVDGADLNNFVLHNASETITRTFTKDVGLYYGIYVKSGLTVDTVVKIQAELGSATAYEPYAGFTIPITFPNEVGTVYGGTLDVVSGVLTVDSELEVFNEVENGNIISRLNYLGSSGSVGTVGDYSRISFAVRTEVDQSKYSRISSSYTQKMCNMLKHSFAYNEESAHWYRNTILYSFFPTTLVGSTIGSVVAYLTSIKDTTPLSFWIPLTTPITYQLTPTQITALLGQNNVWADAGGSTTVIYRLS